MPYTPGTGIDIIARTVGIVMKWNRELEQILALPDVRETFTRQGMVPAHSSPEDLARQIAADVQRWKKFIAETGIKAD